MLNTEKTNWGVVLVDIVILIVALLGHWPLLIFLVFFTGTYRLESNIKST